MRLQLKKHRRSNNDLRPFRHEHSFKLAEIEILSGNIFGFLANSHTNAERSKLIPDSSDSTRHTLANAAIGQKTPVDAIVEATISEDEFNAVEAEVSNESDFNSLDPRSVVLNRIGSFIWVGILSIGSLIGAGSSFALNQWIGLWWLVGPIAFLALIGLLVWFAYYWPMVAFRHAKWRLVATGLEIHRGVFWRHRISIPAARVQHVDVSQGPLQRHFELGSLIVHTAGTSNASVMLEGLAFETAQQLRDELVQQRESLDVT